MDDQYYVEIVERKSGMVVKRSGPLYRGQAYKYEKVIELDHDRYCFRRIEHDPANPLPKVN